MAPHAQFYALLRQMPHAEKEQLVFDASGGKTTSLSEFVKSDKKGYNRLLDNMQKIVGGQSLKRKNAGTAV